MTNEELNDLLGDVASYIFAAHNNISCSFGASKKCPTEMEKGSYTLDVSVPFLLSPQEQLICVLFSIGRLLK